MEMVTKILIGHSLRHGMSCGYCVAREKSVNLQFRMSDAVIYGDVRPHLYDLTHLYDLIGLSWQKI